MNEKPEIYIDGLNVFMRHFAANPARSLNGQLCGGIVGMLRNIQHLAEKFKPEKVIVVWECEIKDLGFLNKKLKNDLKSSHYNITVLSNIVVHQIKEVLEYLLRI